MRGLSKDEYDVLRGEYDDDRVFDIDTPEGARLFAIIAMLILRGCGGWQTIIHEATGELIWRFKPNERGRIAVRLYRIMDA